MVYLENKRKSQITQTVDISSWISLQSMKTYIDGSWHLVALGDIGMSALATQLQLG